MLPHNNNYSYQGPNRGNYTFDLKVNVDLNNGKVNLGVPNQVTSLAIKPEATVLYTDQTFVNSHNPHLSTYTASYKSNKPIFKQVSQMCQPTPNYVFKAQPFNSAYNPQKIEQSYLMKQFDKQKLKSANDTYPQTSFSMGIQKSVDAVECVICDKAISREYFNNHLEEHKNRNKNHTQKQPKIPQQSDKINFISTNQKQLQKGVVLNKQYYPQTLPNQQSIEANLSNLDKSKNVSRSRQIQGSYSRIVYAPRDPSQIVDNSQFTYSRTLGYIHNNITDQQPNQTSRQANIRNYQGIYIKQNEINSSPNIQNSRVSKVSSMNLLPSQLLKKEDSRSASYNKQSMQSYYQENIRSTSANKNNRFQNNFNKSNSNNIYTDRSQSRILRPQQQKKQPSFSDIEQSVIHRINEMSKDHSIIQLKKQLNIEQIQEQSSSDQQRRRCDSIRGNPSCNLNQNFSRSKNAIGVISTSNTTDKLSRSKLPVNYLAREEFIINSMLTRSCYKSRHMNWK